MEWQIPIQKVELSHINIGNPWARDSQKPLAPLSYFGLQFRLPFLSILFPPLRVSEYNSGTGRLLLDMSETTLAAIKLNTLQETILNSILYHQSNWFHTQFSKEDVKGGFQPMFEENALVLHCPSRSNIPFYKSGWQEGVYLRPGMRVRVAVKIHGISFLMRADGSWSGRCRLQHRIQGVIVQE